MNKRQLQLEAKVFKGLADQSRLAILEAFSEKTKTVSQIVKETGLSQPNVSTHLACLLGCGLVAREKQGRQMFYKVSMKEVKKVLNSVRKILNKHSKEIYQCTRY